MNTGGNATDWLTAQPCARCLISPTKANLIFHFILLDALQSSASSFPWVGMQVVLPLRCTSHSRRIGRLHHPFYDFGSQLSMEFLHCTVLEAARTRRTWDQSTSYLISKSYRKSYAWDGKACMKQSKKGQSKCDILRHSSGAGPHSSGIWNDPSAFRSTHH